MNKEDKLTFIGKIGHHVYFTTPADFVESGLPLIGFVIPEKLLEFVKRCYSTIVSYEEFQKCKDLTKDERFCVKYKLLLEYVSMMNKTNKTNFAFHDICCAIDFYLAYCVIV